MTPVATIALLGYPLVVMLLFQLLAPRRAIIAAFVIGVMYLPFTAFVIPGFPNYTKTTAISIGCIVAASIFDASTLLRYRFHWLDSLICLGITGYAASSIGNGLGSYDALSASVDFVLQFGIPYFLGRVYLGTPGALKDVAIGLMIGFISYIPIMVFEFRMSAKLAWWLYGAPSSAGRGGFLFLQQPAGFFLGPLPLSTYLGPLAALAVWLAIGRSWKGWWILSAWAVAGVCCLFTCLAFGRGSIVIMAVGAGAAVLWKHARLARAPQFLAAAVIAYLLAGLGGGAAGVRQATVDASEVVFGAAKAASLDFRFRHEAVLVERGWESPVYGVGGWGRNRISKEEALRRLGHRSVVTDGLWVIIFSERGLMGLISVWGWMLLPGMLAVQWVRKLPMAGPQKAVVLGLATWSFLYAGDCLLNAFWTPTQPLVAGGLASFCMLAAKVAPGLRRDRSVAVARAARSEPKPAVSTAVSSRETTIDLGR